MNKYLIKREIPININLLEALEQKQEFFLHWDMEIKRYTEKLWWWQRSRFEKLVPPYTGEELIAYLNRIRPYTKSHFNQKNTVHISDKKTGILLTIGRNRRPATIKEEVGCFLIFAMIIVLVFLL